MKKNNSFYVVAIIVHIMLFVLVGCSSEPVLNENQKKRVDTICAAKDSWNASFQDGGKEHSINKLAVIEKDGECLLIVGWVFSTGDYGSVKTYGGKSRTYKVTESGVERKEADSNVTLFSGGIDVNLGNAADSKIKEYVENAYLNYLRQSK